ncbi:hypothetical protein [Fischerella sp. PCC 9605]|uniref:hypothetical protein n=1 Tax=Fischerella sp. PCC 9605 TaxID=1173024 RepID=UPI00047BEDEB|nr:hypothetical protein [Fischerella sp. PCC 9605]
MKTPTKIEYAGYVIEVTKIKSFYCYYIRGLDLETHESGFATPKQALLAAKTFIDGEDDIPW